jgi:riboflavin kinase/FMN adenylyltransferase
MNICYDFRKIKLSAYDRPVVTMGTFDGVHRGHQEILKRVTNQAKQTDKKSVLLTYHPHPRQVLFPDEPLKFLTILEEKIRLIEAFGIDEMVILNFDRSLANTPARQFVNDILIQRLLPGHLVVGYDHGFGKDRKGGIELLQEFGQLYDFAVEVVAPVKVGEENISSSKIRRAFAAGGFNAGIKMLGHGYPLKGTVKMGTGLGKKLGFPTCNLVLPEEKLLPPTGIYSCRVELRGARKMGMAYVGTKPTLLAEKNPELSVEVHVLDFEGSLYDQSLLAYLEEWIRPDRRFADLEKLRNQIQTDEKIIREKLSTN